MTDPYSSPEPVETGDPRDDARAFRRALGQYATGVTIVTASNGIRHVGVTANSFSSLSLDPPLVLWSIDRKSTSLATFLEASHFAVNILAHAQTALSTRFSRTSEEKFNGVNWKEGRGKAPLLDGALVHLQCRREYEYDGGDHLIMVGRVEQYARYEVEPLIFARGRYARAVDCPAAGDASTQQTDAAQPRVEPTLLQSLLRTYEGISAKFDIHRQAEGLTLNQSRALALLTRTRAESIPHIMREALLGQGAAEDAIANLVERKFAVVEPDGGYSITDLGLETSLRLRQKLRDVEMQVFGRIPGLDFEATRKLILALGKVALE